MGSRNMPDAKWDKVIITSNLSPEKWHPMACDEHREALNNRIGEWKEFTGTKYPIR